VVVFDVVRRRTLQVAVLQLGDEPLPLQRSTY
jgi:hypothetical protein